MCARCLTCWLVELVSLALLSTLVGVHTESEIIENYSTSVSASLNLEGFNFSSVAVSRSPNSGQSLRSTAGKTRAYHG